MDGFGLGKGRKQPMQRWHSGRLPSPWKRERNGRGEVASGNGQCMADPPGLCCWLLWDDSVGVP